MESLALDLSCTIDHCLLMGECEAKSLARVVVGCDEFGGLLLLLATNTNAATHDHDVLDSFSLRMNTATRDAPR